MERDSRSTALLLAGLVTVFAASDRSVALAPLLAVTILAGLEHVVCHVRIRQVRLKAAAAPLVVEGDAAVHIGVTVRPAFARLRLGVAVNGRAVETTLGSSLLVGDRVILPWSTRGACVLDGVSVDMALSMFGLWPARLRADVPLAHPVHRGPNLIGPGIPLMLPEELSSLRPYRPGDRSSRVNWAASARTTQLYVRAEERSGADAVVVVDSGPSPTTPDDSWLGNAGGFVTALLASGSAVRLVTREARGLNTSVIDAYCLDEVDVLRRLASVVPGPRLNADDCTRLFTPIELVL